MAVLAEYLMFFESEKIHAALNTIKRSARFEMAPFGELAAIECVKLINDAEWKAMDPNATKAKFRFDRQLQSICLMAFCFSSPARHSRHPTQPPSWAGRQAGLHGS